MKTFRYAVGLAGLLVASHAMAQYGVWTKKSANGSWVAPRTGFTSARPVSSRNQCVSRVRAAWQAGGDNSATRIVETATG